MSNEIFDKNSALDRVGGDLDLLIELAGMFMEDCPNIVSQIEGAVESGDADTLYRSAHTLKGAVGNFSAQATFDAAYELEMKGRNNELDGSKKALDSLKQQLSLLEPELSSL